MKAYRRLARHLVAICLAMCLVACNPPMTSRCTAIHHSQPPFAVDHQPFLRDGCQLSPARPSLAQCSSSSPVAMAGCSAVTFMDELGGLDPHDAPAICGDSWKQAGARAAFEVDRSGAYHVLNMPNTYILYRDGAYHVLSTPEQLRAWYAPIESADEALSYAVAMTGYRPRYGLNICDGIYASYTPLVKQIEDTHVERLVNGYRVYLFDEDFWNGITSIVIDVAQDGTITRSGGEWIAKPI